MAYSDDRYKYTKGPVIFLIGSAVLFLGAIGLFIWLVIDAAEDELVKSVLYGTAFLAITLGLLVYSLFVSRNPKLSNIILWSLMVLGIATFIVGLCMRDPEPEPSQLVNESDVPTSSVSDIIDLEP